MEENVSMNTTDTSGIDVIEGAAVTGCESAAVGEEPGCGETAVMEPVPADDGAEGEEETGQKAAAPFWGKKRIGIACGIAAALVVGAVGVGALAMVPADAGTAAPKADPAGKLAGTSGTKADAAKGAPNATAGASSGDAAAETGAEGADAAQDAAAAGDGQTAEAAAGTEETATGDPAGAPASSAPEDKAAPSSGSGNSSGSKATSGGSSSGGSSSGSSSKPAASAPEKEEHKHDWQPVYEKQWVENWVTVTDEAAWDEPIYAKVDVCNKCGTQFESSSEAAAHREEYALKGEGGHSSYGKKVQVDTKHHDAVTHQEDQGHYEKVKTGEKCSGCGQTR